LSKDECRQEVVKEALKCDIFEVNDKKKIEEKHAKVLNEISELNRVSEDQELLIERLEAELRDLKLAFVGQKDKSDQEGPVEGGGAFSKGEAVCEVGVEVPEPLCEEGVRPEWEGQGQNSNMYDRMKANPRAREDSLLLKSPFIVYYRKRRHKSSNPQMDV